MNIPEYYPPPTIVPPVPADNPAKGCTSDHSTVVATPLAKPGLVQHINEYSSNTCRPLPESGKLEFGQWIMQEKWDCIQPGESPDSQVEALKNKMNTKLDAIFPTKTVRVCQKDKAYINADIKKLDRLVKREYRKHGKSAKYMKLVEKYNLKMKKAAADHLNKNVRALKESDPGKAYSTLKRMGAQPGDLLDDGSFSVKSHLEANLTNKESVERIADHFSKISQEYPKINPDSLPEDVQLKLISRLDEMNIPSLDELDVYQRIIKAKKPNAGVPGDLPKSLIQEFAPELATPLSKIYNNIIRTGKWPSNWKVEYEEIEQSKN